MSLESMPTRVQTSVKTTECTEYDPGLSQNVVNSSFGQRIPTKKFQKDPILFWHDLNCKPKMIENGTVAKSGFFCIQSMIWIFQN